MKRSSSAGTRAVSRWAERAGRASGPRISSASWIADMVTSVGSLGSLELVAIWSSPRTLNQDGDLAWITQGRATGVWWSVFGQRVSLQAPGSPPATRAYYPLGKP